MKQGLIFTQKLHISQNETLKSCSTSGTLGTHNTEIVRNTVLH